MINAYSKDMMKSRQVQEKSLSKIVLFSSELVASQGPESCQCAETMTHRIFDTVWEKKIKVLDFISWVSNFRMNLTEKAVEYLKASDRALGCGFGDKNGEDLTKLLSVTISGLTLVIRGKIGSGDIAFGIHALQRTLDCQNGDEIKLVTVDRYK